MLYTICMVLLLYKMRMYIHYTEHIHVYTCKYTTYVYIYASVCLRLSHIIYVSLYLVFVDDDDDGDGNDDDDVIYPSPNLRYNRCTPHLLWIPSHQRIDRAWFEIPQAPVHDVALGIVMLTLRIDKPLGCLIGRVPFKY